MRVIARSKRAYQSGTAPSNWLVILPPESSSELKTVFPGSRSCRPPRRPWLGRRKEAAADASRSSVISPVAVGRAHDGRAGGGGIADKHDPIADGDLGILVAGVDVPLELDGDERLAVIQRRILAALKAPIGASVAGGGAERLIGDGHRMAVYVGDDRAAVEEAHPYPAPDMLHLARRISKLQVELVVVLAPVVLS